MFMNKPMNLKVNWEVPFTDIGLYDTEKQVCTIVSININADTKEVWGVTYKYGDRICDCGCGMKIAGEEDIVYCGQLTETTRKKILKAMPDYTIQKLKWS